MSESLNVLPIYNIAYIAKELKAIQKDEDRLVWGDLTHLDQLHYFGTTALDHLAQSLKIKKGDRILEVGSGLGGPARYLAANYKCHMMGVELQNDLFQTSVSLTKRCGLDQDVQFVKGDFTRLDFSGMKFDNLISLLVFLHIPNKEQLFLNCAKALRAEGGLYIEDFYIRKPLADFEKNELMKQLACSRLQTREEYLASLQEAGFTNLVFEDLTESWGEFLAKRWSDFQKIKTAKISFHGEETVARLDEFYEVTSELFANRNLGGVRIQGQKYS